MKSVNINGTVKNKKSGKPIKADIVWKNMRSNEVFVASQTEKKGSYEMEVILNNQSNTFPKYELSVYSDKYFPEIKIFSTKEANELNDKKIDFELHRVKTGLNNEELGIIYFRANNTVVVSSSEAVKTKLLKFMQLNEKAEIILEREASMKKSIEVSTCPIIE